TGESQNCRGAVRRREQGRLRFARGGLMTKIAGGAAPLSRRSVLKTASSAAALATAGVLCRPSISRANDRPLITHGMQSGDVTLDSGVAWARTDRPARMLVEVSTTESFKTIHSAVSVDALPESDFTAKA